MDVGIETQPLIEGLRNEIIVRDGVAVGRLIVDRSGPHPLLIDITLLPAHRNAGIGLASVLANVIYVPAKLTYAALGGLTGAAAWALTAGNTDIAKGVWVASLGGDYFLAHEMVAGDRKIHFSGPTEAGM